MHPAMSLWADNKDRDDDECRHNRRKRIDVKRKRAADKIAIKMKEGMKKNKRAKKAGVTHESGIGNESASSA